MRVIPPVTVPVSLALMFLFFYSSGEGSRFVETNVVDVRGGTSTQVSYSPTRACWVEGPFKLRESWRRAALTPRSPPAPSKLTLLRSLPHPPSLTLTLPRPRAPATSGVHWTRPLNQTS